MSPEPVVRTARPDEGQRVADLVARAFHGLDIHRWLVPDPGERERIFPVWFRRLVEHAERHGSVLVTDDLSGAEISLRHPSPPFDPLDDAELTALCGANLPRFRHFTDLLTATHPPAGVYEYLMLIAVDPGRQGEGVGAALMRARLALVDEAGLIAHTEGVSPAIRHLCRRNGFIDSAPQVRLPDDGGALYPMRRDARRP